MRKIIIALFFMFLLAAPSFAESDGDKLRELREQINEYTGRIKELQSQAVTLGNQIAQFDAGISLAELQIEETQERIALLGGRIGQLSDSLNDLSNAFESRVAETYKIARLGQDPLAIIVADDLNLAVSRFHYLQEIQKADRDLLSRLERAQTNYIAQRDELQVLEEELGEKRQVLSAQKSAKADLLRVTKNDEKTFQQLLAKARAELEAIQAIIAGKGEETEVGGVGEGERIASIIPSASACSTGAHLHFEVVKDRTHQNPFNFLGPKSLIWDNGDPEQNGNGSWQWPLSDPIRVTQGFGQTAYSSRYASGLHTGIDITNQNKDYTVKAVRTGTLYRGAIACGGGTLRYVRVQQNEGFDTYYLHVNY